MILDISDSTFRDILCDEELYLPLRWNGIDYANTLENLYSRYEDKLMYAVSTQPDIHVDMDDVKRVTDGIVDTVKMYLAGFPADAYKKFCRVMDCLIANPLIIYRKSVLEQFGYRSGYDDPLKLFRATRVDDNQNYRRRRIFHTPYNLRSKVSTCRYSIAGYPSLYLSTSLQLCCKEMSVNSEANMTIAAAFKLVRDIRRADINIQVIELGIKPQDFVTENGYNETNRSKRISTDLLRDINHPVIKSAYLLWYPLIAACSYIRINKKDPFAAEYIIPQLLMQWIRKERQYTNTLTGIRYFSCASNKASEMGFNYVFPTSGEQESSDFPYCKTLTKAFRLTKPVFVHEYDSISQCEDKLRELDDAYYKSPKL